MWFPLNYEKHQWYGLPTIKDNPAELPLVEEDWFQAADESAHPIVAGHGQAMVRDILASQIDGHSFIDEPLTPSDDPSEPTQMDPPGGFDPDQESPFTLAKARATQSHVEAVVSSVDDAPAGTLRHPVPQVADNEENQQATTVGEAFGEPRNAVEILGEVSLSVRRPRADQTLEDFRVEDEIRVATIASLADTELAEVQSSVAQSNASAPAARTLLLKRRWILMPPKSWFRLPIRVLLRRFTRSPVRQNPRVVLLQHAHSSQKTRNPKKRK